MSIGEINDAIETHFDKILKSKNKDTALARTCTKSE